MTQIYRSHLFSNTFTLQRERLSLNAEQKVTAACLQYAEGKICGLLSGSESGGQSLHAVCKQVTADTKNI